MESDYIISNDAGDDDQTEDEDDDEPPNLADQLDQFRSQWHQELSRKLDGSDHITSDTDEQSVEERARDLFLSGVQAEQTGFLYEAVKFYRRAIQLVPDIEFRVEVRQFQPQRRRERTISNCSNDSHEDIEEDLVYHFQHLKTGERAICVPNYQQRACHISTLPVEILVYILKWVISTELDMRSLEQVSMVCRGFYLCARDDELWKLVCQRIWGVNCGSKKKYCSWRLMYVDRPHMRYDGCYIGKTMYYRQGEQSLDGFYKPFHVVEYYRYVRFFPDGSMLMMTSPDEPLSTIPKLKGKHARPQGVLFGYYRLLGNTVTGVLKRAKVPEYINNRKYHRQRQQQNQALNQNEGEHTFNVELDLCSVGHRRHAQLTWRHYSTHTKYRSTSEERVTDFVLDNKSYPPLYFSRVKSYTATSEQPLA